MATSPEADPNSHSAQEGAAQRRLARLRFDLHDGPQQDLHLLAQDVALFRRQLDPLLADHPDRDRALGRLDDIEAQLTSLDQELRRLSAATQEPLTGGVPEALGDLADAFAHRTGITPTVQLGGDLGALTDSQRLAVIAVTREALSNVRKHGRAAKVEISVRAGEEGVELSVRDDGAGFDIEHTPGRAAREGHLGLVGMRERVEMLGGRFAIESRAGGPTIVSATLPRWPTD